MKSVLRWISGSDEERPPESKRVELSRVEEFVRFFPIGVRLRYSPEFQVSTKIESILLGYRVNGKLVFETHSMKFTVVQGELKLSLRTPVGWEEITAVDDFCFILPHQLRSEVDFGSAFGDSEGAREKKVNDFRRGSAVRLMNKGNDGKVPSVETTVMQTMGITQGVYSNLRVALLMPDPDSFMLMDQRVFHRIYTQIPSTVAVDVNGPRYVCSVLDFSERYLRLNMEDSPKFTESMREGTRLFVIIDGDGAGQAILLGGQVYRKRGPNVILALTHILKDRRLQRLDPIDELELKTRLLHHPKTLECQSDL